MTKRLGRLAGMIVLVAVCAAAVFFVPILLFNTSPILSGLFVLVLLGAFAIAWIAEFMYRKAYPSLFEKFEKPRTNKIAAGRREE